VPRRRDSVVCTQVRRDNMSAVNMGGVSATPGAICMRGASARNAATAGRNEACVPKTSSVARRACTAARAGASVEALPSRAMDARSEPAGLDYGALRLA
jgi:hypothetical protein